MQLEFYKYHGTGNDFILINNLDGRYQDIQEHQIHALCNRHMGIGADGLMLLEKHEHYDFQMRYFNSDGKPGSMCGNGGRCIVHFAHFNGIAQTKFTFLAPDGVHEATLLPDQQVCIEMLPVTGIERQENVSILNTGSPHYVCVVNDVQALDVYEEGRKIRYNERFHHEGINVNFVQKLEPKKLFVRTYERGVENETLSCGTGVVASAIAVPDVPIGLHTIDIETKGGNLKVEFRKRDDTKFEDIKLIGPAKMVFKGSIQI